MSWIRETLAECVTQAETRIVAALDLVSPVLPVALARVLARVVAGARHSLNGYIAWSVRQIFTQTADEEALTAQAEADGVVRNAATYATYRISPTGTAATPVPQGSILRAATGTEFAVQVDGVVGGADLTIVALVEGAAGNLAIGTVVTFEPTIDGVNATATTLSGVDGVEREELEDYRARYLAFRRATILGGHETEYTAWARAVPGVSRVWTYPRQPYGLGSVQVIFVRDADTPIIPDVDEVTEVDAAIQAKRPATADVYVSGPEGLQPVFFTIGGVPSAADRAAIEAELKDAIWTVTEPGNGTTRGQLTLDEIREAIRRARKSYVLTAPVADTVPSPGYLLAFGAITWT